MQYRKQKTERTLKRLSLIIFVFMFSLICTHLQASKTTKFVTYADGKLDNGIITVAFDLKKGVFSIYDAQSKEVLLSNARFGLPSGEMPKGVKVLKKEDVQDVLGSGKRLVLEVTDWNLLRYASFRASGASPARHLFSYTLVREQPRLGARFWFKNP